jgi:hypothetical protein
MYSTRGGAGGGGDESDRTPGGRIGARATRARTREELHARRRREGAAAGGPRRKAGRAVPQGRRGVGDAQARIARAGWLPAELPLLRSTEQSGTRHARPDGPRGPRAGVLRGRARCSAQPAAACCAGLGGAGKPAPAR